MSDLDDIVGVGFALTSKNLISAYSQGIFPWPAGDDVPLLWYSPDPRAVLNFEKMHLPRSLLRSLRKNPWRFTVNQAFERVISECQNRGQEGTWITPELKKAYLEFHELGYAQSVEVWRDDQLVGGLYGVECAGYFAGESMFHRESDASKAALIFAVSLLKRVGRSFMDIQVLTKHLEAMGAEEIDRASFLKKIEQGKKRFQTGNALHPFPDGLSESYSDFSSWIT